MVVHVHTFPLKLKTNWFGWFIYFSTHTSKFDSEEEPVRITVCEVVFTDH